MAETADADEDFSIGDLVAAGEKSFQCEKAWDWRVRLVIEGRFAGEVVDGGGWMEGDVDACVAAGEDAGEDRSYGSGGGDVGGVWCRGRDERCPDCDELAE